jgi:hypothetical protein
MEFNMNLTQTQKDAKEAYLNQQQEQMLSLYEKADTEQRRAIIKHVDSFLSTCNSDEKKFWLKFRRQLEVLNEKAILFPLGNIYLTIGAKEALAESNELPFKFLSRHQTGDWGELCEDDKRENELSVKEGFRILSAYRTTQNVKLWIISEATRETTTILLPEEY